MQWEFVVALTLVIPIIVFPVVLVWYLNVGGLYVAFKEGRVIQAIAKKAAGVLLVVMPIGIYVLAVWYFFGHFGWQVALSLSVAFPIVLLIPVLVWAAITSGLLQVLRDVVRRRVAAPRRRVLRPAEAPVLDKTV